MNAAPSSANAHGAAVARQRAEGVVQRQPMLANPPITPKHIGYGLPCAHCKTYYAADLPACPICKSPQRVSPLAPMPRTAPAERLPDPEQLERERERFLTEYSAQVVATPLPPESPVPGQNCIHLENHPTAPEPASICQACYDRLQERADVLEAALHIDLKEAAQIIYDAVWADPSDPNKTYQNAAQALLAELRRRSGTPQVFGPLQPPVN